jgi:hypothetical protein
MAVTNTEWCVAPSLVAGPVGRALVASPSGKRPADKPLDPLGALSLSKRRRPYIRLHRYGFPNPAFLSEIC